MGACYVFHNSVMRAFVMWVSVLSVQQAAGQGEETQDEGRAGEAV